MLVAVTTCPGREYLEGTLASLQAAGFEDIGVFNDSARLGSRWNYWRIIGGAARSGDSVLIVQDDVLVSPRLHALAHAPIPPNVGVVTFHDCSMDFPLGTEPGEYVLPVANLEGAQCLLFPHESLAFLAARWVDARERHNVDIWIGRQLAEGPRPNKLVVRRGLVEHVGRVSICHPDRVNFPQDTQTVHDLPCVGPEDPSCRPTT